MKAVCLLALTTLVGGALDAATWQTARSFGDLGSQPLMGFVRKDGDQLHYNVTLNLGIEQYEQGKRGAHRDQQWFLQCSYATSTGDGKTWCKLQRTVLDRVFDHLGTLCNETEHSTSDGTLELVDADWRAGNLDFNIIHGDESKTNVFINMLYKRDSIYLHDLKAGINARGAFGSAASLEFRVPEYTYVEQVPIVMTGMKNQWDKEWDSMVRTLSPPDRRVVEKLVDARLEIVGSIHKHQLETEDAKALQKLDQTAPDDKQPFATLTERISKASGDHFLKLVEDWLSHSEMSSAGKATVLGVLRAH